MWGSLVLSAAPVHSQLLSCLPPSPAFPLVLGQCSHGGARCCSSCAGRRKAAWGPMEQVHASTALACSQWLPSSSVCPSTSWSCLKAAAGTSSWPKVQGPRVPAHWFPKQAAALILGALSPPAAHHPLPGEGRLETAGTPWQPGAGLGGAWPPPQWQAGMCRFPPLSALPPACFSFKQPDKYFTPDWVV